MTGALCFLLGILSATHFSTAVAATAGTRAAATAGDKIEGLDAAYGKAEVRVAPPADSPWRLLWRQPTVRVGAFRQLHESFGQPAVSTRLQRVIVATGEGDIIAYSLAQGAEVWRYTYGAPLETAAFLVQSGGALSGQERVLVATRDSILLALDVASGALVWTADIEGEVRAAPRLAEGLVLITTTANKVSALEPDTGQVVWTDGRPAPTGLTVEGHARAAIADGRVFVAFSDGFGAAYSLKEGHLLWSRPLSLQGGSFVDADADPVVVGGQVFMASYADGVYALSVEDGQTQWHQPAPAVSTLAWVAGGLLAGSAQGMVWGLDPTSGAVRWRTHLGATPLSRLTEAGPYAVLTAGTAGLIVLDAHNGRPRQASGLGERAANDLTTAHTFLSFVSATGNLYLWQQGTAELLAGHHRN